MKPTSDLGAEGKRAFTLAVEHVATFDDPTRFEDAIRSFARSIHTLELARRRWVEAGEPLTTIHANGTEYEHPLVKLISDLERDAYRARRALRLDPDSAKKGQPGRPMGAASSRDRVVKQLGPVIEVNVDEDDDALA